MKNQVIGSVSTKISKLALIGMLYKISYLLALFIILLTFFVLAKPVQAEDFTSDLFNVPLVIPTQSGPKVIPDNSIDPALKPNSYTPGSYVVPKYDPFNSQSPKVVLPEENPDSPPKANFNVRTDRSGLGDMMSGTVNTSFIFDASASTDKEDNFGFLEARWDFENDGEVDSYFSRIKRIKHTFDNPGIYEVKLEVLDTAGNVSVKTKKITIVENTEPMAYFTVDKIQGTPHTIFAFDTSLSSDSQYQRNTLAYRFDFESDGKWDTAFENKTRWYHTYEKVGQFKVTMEVRDFEGLKSTSHLSVSTVADHPPSAAFQVERIETRNGFNPNQYHFDASASSDDHTQLNDLLFRWDFNYTGKNDITWDTAFIRSPHYNGKYILGGKKNIRLQVKDSDGNIAESFAIVHVPWLNGLKMF